MFAAGAAALLAGCSDATRFSDPFADPFQESTPRSIDRAPTGAISRPYAQVPRSRVQSRPLPPPQAVSQAAPPAVAPAPRVAQAAPAVARAGGSSHWSAEGGAPVVVANGETAGVIATRYGVPLDALLRVNAFQSASEVRPGTRLIIPTYRASAVESHVPAMRAAESRDHAAPAPVARRAPVEEPRSERRVAAKAEPVRPAPVAQPASPARAELGRRATRQPVEAARPRVAQAEPAPRPARPEPARKIAEPVRPTATAEPARKQAHAEPARKPEPSRKIAQAEPARRAAAPAPIEPRRPAKAEPAPKPVRPEPARKIEALPAPRKAEPKARDVAKAETPAPEARRSVAIQEKREQEKREQKIAAAEAPAQRNVDKTPTASIPAQEERPATASDAAHPEFRWPARGRIIQGFNSGGNDGINISVPEGTSVKAAEGGVVAYAGSELKGYGNLVLIRHPNGFVSAYAHNGALEVKRGDQVKRGQTIAKSGQSGNVGSPQLHFELRKGSTPVDPTSYLAGL
jgi:murein DD-endopeptidase MepM/ murein hydrolase activator NlpD